MKGMQEGDKLTTSELWSELKPHEFSKLKGKIEREETTSRNLALVVKTKASISGNDKSDLHALFMKRMERLERKIGKISLSSEDSWSSDRSRRNTSSNEDISDGYFSH